MDLNNTSLDNPINNKVLNTTNLTKGKRKPFGLNDDKLQSRNHHTNTFWYNGNKNQFVNKNKNRRTNTNMSWENNKIIHQTIICTTTQSQVNTMIDPTVLMTSIMYGRIRHVIGEKMNS